MASGSIKLPLLGITTLIASVLIASWIGQAPTAAKWGEDGVHSMRVAGGICLGAAVLGFLPVVLIAALKPALSGQAALAGTVIRLLATMAGLGAYQVLSSPHMASFLMWAVIYYCLLLLVETTYSVVLVRRAFATGGPREALPA